MSSSSNLNQAISSETTYESLPQQAQRAFDHCWTLIHRQREAAARFNSLDMSGVKGVKRDVESLKRDVLRTEALQTGLQVYNWF